MYHGHEKSALLFYCQIAYVNQAVYREVILLLGVIDKAFLIGGPGHGKSTLLVNCQIFLMVDQVAEKYLYPM